MEPKSEVATDEMKGVSPSQPAHPFEEASDRLLAAEGMDCPSCATTVTRSLLEIDGVHSVEPDIITQAVRVRFDRNRATPEALAASLHALGYGRAAADMASPPDPASADSIDAPRRFDRFLTGIPRHVLFGGVFWTLSITVTILGGSEALVGALALATVASAGWSVFPRALAAGRRGILDMHVLMAVAAMGALVIGEYIEAGAVLFLFAIAQDLERRTLHRARSSVRSLMNLSPVEATVLRHGHQVSVPVDAVRKGERVLVRPGERIPVDGTVLNGASAVDASAITGESMPESRFAGDRVFGGSVNGTGALEIRCDQTAADSALSRILKGIEDARSRKSPTEAFVDRFARIYTPLVMLAALAVAMIPPILGMGPWAEWGYRALVLVVIACPCALVISTPVTVVSALTGAARRGILVKSGTHLEALGHTRVVAFDKTGTLTEGRPFVSGSIAWNAADPREVLRMAAAAESRSEHPIAQAIIDEASRVGISLPDRVEMTALPGRGIRAQIEDRTVLVGSPRFLREEAVVDADLEPEILQIESLGGTVVLVAWQEPSKGLLQLKGALVLGDRIRPDLAQLLAGIRSEGVNQVVLMSGDRTAAVSAVTTSAAVGEVGFDEWRAGLLPEEKVGWIRTLQARHGPVLMVGDGVNDAPALAAADIGMAMGSRGTALALDAGDIALMEDNLERIPEALRLGRKSGRIIRANIAFALAVKVAFVLLGTAGYATLWMAVVADMGSSLAVILNGLRALRA